MIYKVLNLSYFFKIEFGGSYREYNISKCYSFEKHIFYMTIYYMIAKYSSFIEIH